MGVASGLLRTAGYIGAMLASSLIAIAFSAGANDAALHSLSLVLIVLAAVLLAIAAVRSLPRAASSTR
ncbi:MAG TPA: hypothetical protein VFL13_09575, partial [Candidatus Baltobacteraceae bacterium]|nr:hypothetical protein [Candidatus Baltobacteraceae bacterium]